MDRLRRLETFVCVVDSGSFAAVPPLVAPVAAPVAGNFESNSSEAIRPAACDGIGIGIACAMVRNHGDDLRAERVRPLLSAYCAHPLPVNVVFQPARRPSLKVRSFVDHFAAAFGSDPDIASMIAG